MCYICQRTERPTDQLTDRAGRSQFNTLELTKDFVRIYSNTDGQVFMKLCSLDRDQTQTRTHKTQTFYHQKGWRRALRGGPGELAQCRRAEGRRDRGKEGGGRRRKRREEAEEGKKGGEERAVLNLTLSNPF